MLGRRSKRLVTFSAFDLLWLDGTDCTQFPYENRRRLLEMLELTGPAWCTLPSVPADSATDLLDACSRYGQEGIVLKRRSARYVPGARSPDWRKRKTVEWRTVEAPRRLPAEVRQRWKPASSDAVQAASALLSTKRPRRRGVQQGPTSPDRAELPFAQRKRSQAVAARDFRSPGAATVGV